MSIVVTKQKLISMLLLSAICLFTLFLFVVQIQGTNAYMGMRPLSHDVAYYIVSTLLFCLMLILFPRYGSSPSNIFIGIYLLFTVSWISFLSGVSGYVDLNGLVILFLFLIFPIIFLKCSVPLLRQVIKKFDISSFVIFKIPRSEWFLVVVLIIVLFCVSQYLEFSLSYIDSYVRRMSGRELIGGLLAYALPISLNGIAPFIAFIGMFTKRYYLFAFSLLFVVAGFGFLGTKAPVMVVLLLGIVGLNARLKLVSVVNLFLFFVLFVCVASIVEYTIFGFSWIADIIVRRGFIVVPQNQGYYYDFFINHTSFYDLIFGQHYDKQISFVIGEKYYGNTATNANTNAFLYELGRNGMIGYLFSLLFLSFFYAFMDVLYEKYNRYEALAVSVIYSLLIVEQSYSTAFITSGVVLITFFMLLKIKRRARFNYDCCS